MRRPSFFIVGAPKCGTTALSVYLDAHPNIFVSKPKEPHFFAEDLPGYREVETERDYLALFDPAEERQATLGEASVFYLYSQAAIPGIESFEPDARYIVMFRRPLDVVYSLHAQLVFSRDESETDFETAWNLTPERKRGDSVPRLCRDRSILYYDEIAKFGEQFERMIAHVPPERIKCVFFEDFVKDTQAAYSSVLEFLGVEHDGRAEFPRINENMTQRWSWLADLSMRPPAWATSLALSAKKALGVRELGVLRRFRRMNTVSEERTSLPTELRAAIIEHYKEDTRKLAELTGRNIDSWMAA